jgi:hypothetical protein
MLHRGHGLLHGLAGVMAQILRGQGMTWSPSVGKSLAYPDFPSVYVKSI